MANKKPLVSHWVRGFTIVFLAFVVVGMVWQYQRYTELNQEYDTITTQVAQEQQKQQDLTAQKEYYNSDAYIEQIAREKLGLVKSNEVVYINRAE